MGIVKECLLLSYKKINSLVFTEEMKSGSRKYLITLRLGSKNDTSVMSCGS